MRLIGSPLRVEWATSATSSQRELSNDAPGGLDGAQHRQYGQDVKSAGKPPHRIVGRVIFALTILLTALLVPALSRAISRQQSTPKLSACTNSSQLLTWSSRALVNETIVVPYNALDFSTAANAVAEGYGGIILFGSKGASNLRAILTSLRHLVPRHAGLLVMTDDEGGGVWRLANLTTPLPWARSLASMTPSQIDALVANAGAQMAALGINVDLAPVLDLDGRNEWPGPTNADGYRSFGASGTVVSADGAVYMKALAKSHVLAVIKHFPGLGGVSPNTDYAPAATAPWSYVKSHALVPFQDAINAGARAIMISNATVPGLTTLPASVSRAVMTTVLRDQMHFQGLIMTDSLSAGALSAAHLSLTGASIAALAAGADEILFSVPSSGRALTTAHQITESVLAALAHNKITRHQLLAAAAQVIKAQGANLCA